MRNTVDNILSILFLLFLTFGACQAAGPPSINIVQPGAVPSIGGANVSIFGNRFQPGASVLFGDIPAARVTFVSPSQVDVITPLAARGTVDVAVSNPDGKTDIWSGFNFYYDGDGIFEFRGYNLPPEGDQTMDMEVADIDGDGDQDVLVSSWSKPSPLVYLNNGNGTFMDATATHLLGEGVFAWEASTGDVDGDGDIDILTAGGIFRQSRLFLNNGSGVFLAAPQNLVNNTNANDVELSDVDGDNDLDAFFSTNNGQNLLYLNDGSGQFTDVTATNIPALIDSSLGADMGDVDGDGDNDIIVSDASFPSSQYHLFLNDSSGVFTDVSLVNLPTSNVQSWDVKLEDIDLDGDIDAIFAALNQNLLYLNNGSGTFTDATTTRLPQDGRGGNSVSCGDVDGDGDPDLVFTHNSGPVSLYVNDGAGLFTDAGESGMPVQSFDFTYTSDAAFGNVDGDGDLDLLISSYNQNHLYLNNGNGAFTDVTTTNVPPDPTGGYETRFADVDGDGDLDLAIAARSTQNLLYLNDGMGNYTDGTLSRLPPDSDPTTMVNFADVDSDGDTDMFAANGSPAAQNRLYLNDGSGHFVDVTDTNIPIRSGDSQDVDFGDIDADADLDIIVSNQFGRNEVYKNNGNGVFSDVSTVSLPDSTRSYSAGLGDVDGDGDIDVVFADYQFQEALYLNDGTGIFTNVTAAQLPVAPHGSGNSTDVEMGDVDGDGDLDIYSTRAANATHRLYLNNGAGTFSDASATNLPPNVYANTFDSELGDMDGDGDLDILIVDSFNQRNLLHVNDGNGVFTDETVVRLPFDNFDIWGIDLGDVDSDGDLDAAAVEPSAPVRLYYNVRFTDTEAPTVPTGLTAVVVACDHINLTWNSSTDNVGVVGYTVYRNGIGIGTSSIPSFSDAGLMENTVFTYTVDAYDEAGNQSALSGTASNTTPVCDTCTSKEKSFCGDTIDNDCDGLVDCDDRDCRHDPICEPPPEICDDEIDNDGDGDTDCNDKDCRKDPACP